MAEPGTGHIGPATSPFAGTWLGQAFYDEVTWMRAHQVAGGYTDRAFRLGQDITRGETAVVLKNAHRHVRSTGVMINTGLRPAWAATAGMPGRICAGLGPGL